MALLEFIAPFEARPWGAWPAPAGAGVSEPITCVEYCACNGALTTPMARGGAAATVGAVVAVSSAAVVAVAAGCGGSSS